LENLVTGLSIYRGGGIMIQSTEQWKVEQLVDAIQYVSVNKNVNIYLMPKDHEKEYQRLQIHAIALGEVTGESLDIYVEEEK
jgi:hypothetical protein